jgi:hypothetical protein
LPKMPNHSSASDGDCALVQPHEERYIAIPSGMGSGHKGTILSVRITEISWTTWHEQVRYNKECKES